MAASRKPLTSSTPFLKLVLNGRPDMSADTTLLTSAAFPQLLRSPSRMPCSLPRWNQSGAFVGTSRSGAASPILRRVGFHDFTFEACSSFTRVTACALARPTFPVVGPSPTGDRHRCGALRIENWELGNWSDCRHVADNMRGCIEATFECRELPE